MNTNLSNTDRPRMIRSADNRPFAPAIFAQNGRAMTDSRQVADCFSKLHRDVLRSIDTMLAQAPDLSLRNFAQGSYTLASTGNQEHRNFNMDRDGFTLLAMGFTGKRALGWKIKYIEAFNRMEAELAKRANPDAAQPQPIDLIDASVDLLTTAHLALFAKEWIEADELHCIQSTVEQALKLLAPVRAHLDEI